MLRKHIFEEVAVGRCQATRSSGQGQILALRVCQTICSAPDWNKVDYRQDNTLTSVLSLQAQMFKLKQLPFTQPNICVIWAFVYVSTKYIFVAETLN